MIIDKKIEIDSISLSTTPIFLIKNGKKNFNGTGFFYSHLLSHDKRILYLATALHVLIGTPPFKNKSPIAEEIEFYFPFSSDKKIGKVKRVKYPLLGKNKKPLYITHPLNLEVDAALIPINTEDYSECFSGKNVSLNSISNNWPNPELKVRISTNVVAIGYPFGFHDVINSLPIWKTGNMASEPNIDFLGKPLFLVDISAFKGMSGSPVLAITHEMSELEDNRVIAGGTKKFLGLLTFMRTIKNGFDEIDLQLGYVWKSRIIYEIAQSINLDKYQNSILYKSKNR